MTLRSISPLLALVLGTACGASPAPKGTPAAPPAASVAPASAPETESKRPVPVLVLRDDGSLWSTDVVSGEHSAIAPSSSFPCEAPARDIDAAYDGRLELLWLTCSRKGTLWVMDLRDASKRYVHIASGIFAPWSVVANGTSFPDPDLGDHGSDVSIRLLWESPARLRAVSGWYGEDREGVRKAEQRLAFSSDGAAWLTTHSSRQPHPGFTVSNEGPLEVTELVNRLSETLREPVETCGTGMPFGTSERYFIVCYEVADLPEDGPTNDYALFDRTTEQFTHFSEVAEQGKPIWHPLDKLNDGYTQRPIVFNASKTHVLAESQVCSSALVCKKVPSGTPLGFLEGEHHYK